MRAATLSLCLLLSACASQGPFPSLSPRAAERGLAGGSAPAPCLVDGVAETEAARTTAAPAPPDPALRASIARLQQQAREGQDAFARLLPAAERSVAAAGPNGSDSWIAAQQQISRLEAARARTADAQQEIASLDSARSVAQASNQEDLELLAGAEQAVRTLAEEQQVALNALYARLPSP